MGRTPSLNPKPRRASKPARAALFAVLLFSAVAAFVIGLSVVVILTRG